MDLSEERLQTVLAALPAAHPFHFHLQVSSSNDAALEWLRAGAPAGALVVADEQVHGRGRLKRVWHTPPNAAIALSVVLRPQARVLPQISMLGALAVYDTLRELHVPKIGIKWPNDVLLNGRKVCGVLPEAAWEGETLLGVVLGIGLNVRVDFSHTQPELEASAVNLEAVLGTRINRAELVATLVRHLDAWLPQLGTEALFQTWKQRLVVLGRQVVVTMPDKDVRGFVDNVLTDGQLVLVGDDGTTYEILAGDVSLRVEG